MKTIILSALVLIWLSPIAMALNKIDNHQKGNTFLNVIDQNFKDADKQYLMLMKGLSPDQFPRSYNESKKSLTVSQSDWWCSGFYPGTLLYIFQQTNDTALVQEATRKLQSLEKEQYNKGTHDLGFMMYCSFGNAYRLDPKPEYKSILINSARSLASRFNPKVGCIRSWDTKDSTDCFVIIDNMMNLELLFWATKATGDSSFYKIAVAHANTTMKNHFRPDYSSFHLVNYNAKTGEVKQRKTVQGFADESAWARGQAWALYGYTVMYRETKDARYLEQANHIASYLLNNPDLPSDKIPYWDFNAPGKPNVLRDASAASVMASALLELSGYVNSDLKKKYFANVQMMLETLSQPSYKAAPGTNGGFILKHSVGHQPAGSEVDVPLTYADYYFVEAMLRYQKITGIAQTGKAASVKIEKRREISQYGITWTFDRPVESGQFITGDWWVIGPVTVVKITPAPGSVETDPNKLINNHWGDTSLKIDTRMRNGSMVILQPGNEQGYDSRNGSYRESSSVKLPLNLGTNRSLVSTISNLTLPVDNFCKNILWGAEKKSRVTLKTAVVLTCLSEVPPDDAFRPSFAGTEKPIFRAKDIQWNLLSKLKPTGEIPSWEEFEGYFSRCWIDHLMSWEQQELVPNENMPNYGREHARLVSMASLMLMLDVPKERKEKLAIGLIQHGIDLYGVAMAGGSWNEGGGHSSGRKWPILFASIMLDKPIISKLPESAVFHEDTQTYYGKGWFGQTALWQMIIHHGNRNPYEEKSPDQWEQWDKTSESYRVCCNAPAWIGTALAARYMKAICLWGHDAFFDYTDRWMREDDPYKNARGKYPRPDEETKASDPFVTAMWKAYRPNAPEQEYSGKNFKRVWEGNTGVWIPNLPEDNRKTSKNVTGNVQFFPDFKSSYVDNRNVEIWIPVGYETNTGKKYPVLYMHDGQNLFEPGHSFTNQEWEVDETMTKLIAENKVKEAIVVGIWNTPKRFREYQPDKIFEGLRAADKAIRDSLDKEYGGTPLADAYLEFIVNELKPFVDRTFRTLPDKDNTYMMGSSMGGLISIYAIAEYPQVFGGVACLSTHFPISLRHNNPKIPTLSFAYLQHKLSPNLQSKIYFDYGTETLDAWYEPYQKQMDTVMTIRGFTKGKNWETLKFAGEEHSEIS